MKVSVHSYWFKERGSLIGTNAGGLLMQRADLKMTARKEIVFQTYNHMNQIILATIVIFEDDSSPEHPNETLAQTINLTLAICDW